MKFSINTPEIKRFEKRLRALPKTAFAGAVENTLNSMAFDTQREGRRTARDEFVLRNHWTIASVQVSKVAQSSVAAMKSVSGSKAPYMRVQEKGGVKRSKGRYGVPIATPVAAGQPSGTRPRTRLPLRPNRLRNIRLARYANQGKTQPQRNMIQINMAIENGLDYIFLRYGNTQGIYQAFGSREQPQVAKIWDLTYGQVRIPQTQWLSPSAEYSLNRRDFHYRRSIRFQLRKAGFSSRR